MKYGSWLGLVGILGMVNLGGGAPLEGSRKPAKAEVGSYGQTSFLESFESQKRACAIVIGNERTYLGLYVFDRWGNCVARDDFTGSGAVIDDLAVEWFPPEVGPYTIEVRNFGRDDNAFTIVIR